MERLTTNKPVEEMNMTELARNSCYAKDGYAWYRDFETDIDAREFARDLMLNWGFFELDSDEMLSDEIFDETMMDNLQYGSKEIEGLIALFYRNLWAMADLHSRLKAYEDAEEQGLLLRLPCRLGDIIDRIISHNETVTLMFETEVCSFRGLQHFWHGTAWTIPKEYLELPFVKIHGVVPDKITEADTIWIEVRKEAEQALVRMEKENERP